MKPDYKQKSKGKDLNKEYLTAGELGFGYLFHGYRNGYEIDVNYLELFPECPSEFLSKIGDHICDPEIVTEGCCYDKGDCDILDLSQTKDGPHICSTCPEDKQNMLGDGLCDTDLRNEICCYDLGDCFSDTCTIELVLSGFTPGDSSLDNRNLLQTLLRVYGGNFGDLVRSESGDKICNKALNIEECFFDGWDCKVTPCQTCNILIPTWHSDRIGNGICDVLYDNVDCCYDGGDCLLAPEGRHKDCKTCKSLMLGALNDNICHEHLNTEECCFDFGDCSICQTCDGEIDRLGNYVCDDDLNNRLCCYDAMDCMEFMWDDFGPLKDDIRKLWTNDTSIKIPKEHADPMRSQALGLTIMLRQNGKYKDFGFCPSCNHNEPIGGPYDFATYYQKSWILNGLCNMAFAHPACCFDGGDCGCTTCLHPRFAYKVGDGVCDQVLNNVKCCYDGNDCESFASECTQCPRDFVKILRLHKGKCLPSFNTPQCCYSLGACSNINECRYSAKLPLVHKFAESRTGTGESNAIELGYNTHWRGGCPIQFHHLLNDGICDDKIRSWEDVCCYDGGDCIYDIESICPSCQKFAYAFEALRDEKCIPELDNDDCCFSMGYCDLTFTAATCSTCEDYNDFIGNSECDDVLNHEECCFDGGDCFFHHDCISNCPYETTRQGDGVCNANLNIQECCFDAGDCLTDTDEPHIAPTVGVGDFGKEAAVDQIYLAGPPLPLTRRWDFAKRFTRGFHCRRPHCYRFHMTQPIDDSNMWVQV